MPNSGVFDLSPKSTLSNFLDVPISLEVLTFPKVPKLENLGDDTLPWLSLTSGLPNVLMGTPSSKPFSCPELFLLRHHYSHHPPLPSRTKETTLCGLSLRTLNLQLCHQLLSTTMGMLAFLHSLVCPSLSPSQSLYSKTLSRHPGWRTSLLASSSNCPRVFSRQSPWSPANTLYSTTADELHDDPTRWTRFYAIIESLFVL